VQLGMEIGLGPGHVVLAGDPAPSPPKGGTTPQFSAHIYCDQTAGWIKMPLGMEVGLGPGHTVVDGDPAPPKRGHSASAPEFSASVYCGQTGRPFQLVLSTCFTFCICCFIISFEYVILSFYTMDVFRK